METRNHHTWNKSLGPLEAFLQSVENCQCPTISTKKSPKYHPGSRRQIYILCSGLGRQRQGNGVVLLVVFSLARPFTMCHIPTGKPLAQLRQDRISRMVWAMFVPIYGHMTTSELLFNTLLPGLTEEHDLSLVERR